MVTELVTLQMLYLIATKWRTYCGNTGITHNLRCANRCYYWNKLCQIWVLMKCVSARYCPQKAIHTYIKMRPSELPVDCFLGAWLRLCENVQGLFKAAISRNSIICFCVEGPSYYNQSLFSPDSIFTLFQLLSYMQVVILWFCITQGNLLWNFSFYASTASFGLEAAPQKGMKNTAEGIGHLPFR